MGGKDSGGSQDYMTPQPTTVQAQTPEELAQAEALKLGVPYKAASAQELQDAANKQMVQPREAGPPASLDPNAIAGAQPKDATLGDAVAATVLPTTGKTGRGSVPLPLSNGSV